MLNNLLDELAKYVGKSEKQTPKQKKIIETALEIFAEKGYANTSTSEIAKRAGVAEGTIFKHYGTKENLLASLLVPFIKECFPMMADDLFEAIRNEQDKFEDLLRAFFKNRVAFFLENREVFQIFVKEIFYREELKNEILPYLNENISSRMTKLIEFYKQNGQLKELPTPVILKLLKNAIGGFFITQLVLLNKQSVSDEEIDELISFILNGVGRTN